MDDLCKIIDNAYQQRLHSSLGWRRNRTDSLAFKVVRYRIRRQEGSFYGRYRRRPLVQTSKDEKKEKFDSLGVNAPEVVPTQAMRQEAFDKNWETTDDHCMHIYGIARTQNGKEYYMVKNSWGEYGDYKGDLVYDQGFRSLQDNGLHG